MAKQIILSCDKCQKVGSAEEIKLYSDHIFYAGDDCYAGLTSQKQAYYGYKDLCKQCCIDIMQKSIDLYYKKERGKN